jgi:nicotinamidase-related amidase
MNALRQIVGVAPGLHAGATLADALQAWGVDTMLIAGYMTHNCFDSTAREAFHRGYRVGVVADASATRDLPGPDRRSIPVATVHATVLAGLGDRIAEIIDVATVAALVVA